MAMTATLTSVATMPSATVLPQVSAISSRGSATISTVPMRWPLTMTGTSRLAIGGAISAANHDGARPSGTESEPLMGRLAGSGAPAASVTTIRTWRTSRNGEERSARNFSAGTACCMRATASLTRRSASSIDAAISTRVEVRAWMIVTAPARMAAISSMATTRRRSCVRTGRPCQSACESLRADSHGRGNDIPVSVCALMDVLRSDARYPMLKIG